MNSKFSLLLKGSGFRVLQTLVSISIGLLMMPFLISTLGKDLYGLWILITSVVTSYYLLDLGFNQAVTRYVAKYIHKNDPVSANKVINTALVLYSILGLLLFLISIAGAMFGAESLMEGSENLTITQTILIISGLSIALEFPAKAFPGIISAYMRFDVIATVRFSKSIIDAVCIYLAVSNGYGLIAMAMITFITGIISTLIYVRFSTDLFKDLEFSKQHIDKPMFKSIFQFSKWVFVFDMSSTLRDKMDLWFISYYLGAVVLPIYYVAVRLIEYALQFMQQATNLSGPIFTEYYVKGEREKLTRSFSLFIKINIVLGVTVLVGFYLLGYGFIDLWMKEAVPTDEAYMCLLIIASGRFMAYFTTPVQSMLMTLNRHRVAAWIAVGETVLSVVLCMVLIPAYGLLGASIAVAIPYVIGRAFILPFVVAQYIEANLVSLATRITLYALISCVLVLGVKTYILVNNSIGLIDLLLGAATIGALQFILSIVIWSPDERQWIKEFINQKIGARLSKR